MSQPFTIGTRILRKSEWRCRRGAIVLNYSSTKIKLNSAKALKRSPEEWATLAPSTFPKGRHPWNDIYDEAVTAKIGKIINLKSPDELLKLRLLLAYACEDCFRTFSFVGGAATTSQKRKWNDRVIKDVKRLKSTLANSNDFHPSAVSMKKSRALRVIPSSKVALKADELSKALDDFVSLLQEIEKATEGNGKGLVEDLPTQHMQYLQYAVDQMAGIFIHLMGPKAATRIAYEGIGITGIFPEFIRAAAGPTLKAVYVEFSNKSVRLSKLDAQIREAAIKAKSLYE